MKKMRIGLRVRSGSKAWLGGITYVVHWALALNALPEKEKPYICFLYFNEESKELAFKYKKYVDGVYPLSEARNLDLDMVYPVKGIFEAPFEAPWAAWIPDWQCKNLPEMFSDFERLNRDVHYKILATRAPFLALSSQMVCDDTIRILGKEVVPMGKLHFPAVIEDEIADLDEEKKEKLLKSYGIPSKYFIICNQFFKHKNHIIVFKALAKLQDTSIFCVFTGLTKDHRWPDFYNQLQSEIERLGISSKIHILGSISREDQYQLVKQAWAIIQPSKFEGWSTIVEEGRTLGKKMILSRFPVHVEQSPPGACFFNPDDENELAQLLKEIWENEKFDVEKQSGQDLKKRNEEFMGACARKLIQIARETKKNFNPRIHDPKGIVIDVFSQLQARTGDENGAKLFDQFNRFCCSMFVNDPDQLSKFQAQVKKLDPELQKAFEKEMINQIPQFSKKAKLKSFILKIKNGILKKEA